MTAEELLLQVRNNKIKRHSYYTSDWDMDSWIELNGEELEWDDPDDSVILDAIVAAAKDGLVEFVGWQEGLLNQTETLIVISL